ncbi:MAG: circadian clock protein KaiB, partial [Microcystis sp. LE19-12.2C]|nr:circadian clock protein KaiB [Microcystis sp. LE19-12.2C]
MATSAIVLPDIFKGIALFTPGGDLIYCIDPNKQTHWHLNLCAALQSALGLPEPPHFLVPSFTATIDRWRDPYSHRIHTRAEVYPLVRRYQPLLNAIFATDERAWFTVPW